MAKKFIILKFGGTSLKTAELREKVAQKIINTFESGYHPVVVVSAIGRKGDPYATDTLLNFAYEVNRDLPPREADLLMACGEIISGVIMVNTLAKMGYKAKLFTGAQAGIITDDNFTSASILKVKTDKILKAVDEGFIPVVCGFQGVTEDGEVTTLGRGGSDTTAAALGVALKAEFIDIYTDVEGIKTADPRIVEDAKTLEVVTYNEISQLAHEGAKVIRPRAVEIAMQKNIPLRIKSTLTDGEGTLVTSHAEVYGEVIEVIRDRIITGIAHIPGVTQIKILREDTPEIVNLAQKVFKGLALAEISVDFINISPEGLAFTVKGEVTEKAVDVLENMGFTPRIRRNCAKIAAVGAGMTGVPGVMAKIVEALTREQIEILQSTDSYTTIWVLVDGENMEKAVRAIHKAFKLNE
ncbi:aspartate kinase [Carboxydothermus islandicus]|uniref:Aspartokinase n=1 Tax=Carboxydothermus islandicus TaxID=661089 RepID=A0A1L8D5F1_9THEO|nr:aspartate kinase [Carboxydothermus islandicus]GAV26307.1 aspartate kinase [Carboxydothermus islandicus]